MSAVLAAAIGFGGLSLGAGSAMAAGGISASTIEIQFGNRGDRRHDMRRGHFPRHEMRRGHYPRICTNERAVQKVRDLGVRRAHVAWASHKAVKVNGRKLGRPVSVTVGRAPFCPIIRF